MTAERDAWRKTAQRMGITVARGESLESIKAKVTAVDRASFDVIVNKREGKR